MNRTESPIFLDVGSSRHLARRRLKRRALVAFKVLIAVAWLTFLGFLLLHTGGPLAWSWQQ